MHINNNINGNSISGLMAFRRAIDTTSQNISNVNTEGYSRKEVEFSSSAFGVGSEDVRRVYDGFLSSQVRASTSASSQADIHYSYSSRVDMLLSDEQTGLQNPLQDFVNSIQDVADNPASLAAREAMLSDANSLAGRFNSLGDSFSEMKKGMNNQLEVSVDEINKLTEALAEVNTEAMSFSSGGVVPADIADKREQLVNEISKHISVSVSQGDHNSISLYTGNGQVLVDGASSTNLIIGKQGDNWTIVDGRSNQDIGDVNGGILGGISAFRDDLGRIEARMDDLATKLKDELNSVHAGGKDIVGNNGGGFFSGAGASSLSVVIDDPSKIAASSASNASIGNNENILVLAELFDATQQFSNEDNKYADYSATFAASYGFVLADAGSVARSAEINMNAQASMKDNIVMERDNIAGVNLDEEAANLMKYQQAYQAAAQVLAMSENLFQSLLGAVR